VGAKRPVWPVRDAEGKALGDEDLVALLLTGGKVDGRASELARALLSHAGGLASLPEVERSTLMHLGLGENQAAALRAACEIWVRLAWVRIGPRRRSEARLHQLAQFVAMRYQNPDQEVMVVLYMDVRHRVQSQQEVARGSCNQAGVEKRTILRECLLRSARGFVLCHTHPSC
jgi:DNA repair protein RadC